MSKKEQVKVYDLLAKVDSVIGEDGEKVKWQKVGILIEKDKGFSVKLDSLPISNVWDGWLVVKEREKNGKDESL